MSRTLERIRELVTRREVQISDHGYDKLTDDDLFVDDILVGLTAAVIVEDYPAYHKGPCACPATGWTGSAYPCGMGNSQGCVLTSRRGDGVEARSGALERRLSIRMLKKSASGVLASLRGSTY